MQRRVTMNSCVRLQAALLSLLALTTAHVATAVQLDAAVPVLTELRVVVGTSEEHASNQCTNGAAPVGGDWTMGRSTGHFVQLCRTRRAPSELAALADAQQRQVVSRVAVLRAAACPDKWTLVHSPRENVVLCVKRTTLDAARASNSVVLDVDVSQQRYYSDAVHGWTTDPTGLHEWRNSSLLPSRGVFLSVKRPVRAITALYVLRDVDATNVLDACEHTLGSGWEPSGNAVLDSGDANATKPDAATVLCVGRQANETASTNVLHEITLSDSDGSSSACKNDPDALQLTEKIALCPTWRSAEPTTEFVSELVLRRFEDDYMLENDTLALRAVGFEWLSAGLTRNGISPNASVPVHLYSRKYKPQVLAAASSMTDVSPADLAARAKPPLRAVAANNSLSFKILQLADLHYSGNPSTDCSNAPNAMVAERVKCNESEMTRFVDAVLDAEQPDLVVFTGDNVQTGAAAFHAAALDAVVAGVEARGIPHAMVLGNHDDENGFDREEIVRLVMAKPLSYTQRGPKHVDGVGNYVLNVQAPVAGAWGEQGADVFRLYLLDSHGYPKAAPLAQSGYDWVKPSQLAYYEQLSSATQASTSQAAPVPAVMFFHIPLPEYANGVERANASVVVGDRNERVSAGAVNSHLFSALVDRGEVKATFAGHDHVNDFCYKREGVQLCYGGGAGMGVAYGRGDFARRARVVEWTVNERNERALRTWQRRHGDVATATYARQVLYSTGSAVHAADGSLSSLETHEAQPQSARVAVWAIAVPVGVGALALGVGALGLVQFRRKQRTAGGHAESQHVGITDGSVAQADAGGDGHVDFVRHVEVSMKKTEWVIDKSSVDSSRRSRAST